MFTLLVKLRVVHKAYCAFVVAIDRDWELLCWFQIFNEIVQPYSRFVDSVAAMYSASVVEKAVTGCFLLD